MPTTKGSEISEASEPKNRCIGLSSISHWLQSIRSKVSTGACVVGGGCHGSPGERRIGRGPAHSFQCVGPRSCVGSALEEAAGGGVAGAAGGHVLGAGDEAGLVGQDEPAGQASGDGAAAG